MGLTSTLFCPLPLFCFGALTVQGKQAAWMLFHVDHDVGGDRHGALRDAFQSHCVYINTFFGDGAVWLTEGFKNLGASV